MKRPRLVSLGFSVLLGVALAARVFALPCGLPPPADCGGLGYYGTYGSSYWVCCYDATHDNCKNYYCQRYICNYSNPNDPVSYGWTYSIVPNTSSLNCDPYIHGNCY